MNDNRIESVTPATRALRPPMDPAVSGELLLQREAARNETKLASP